MMEAVTDATCALCGEPLDDTAEDASDGNLVHERCAEEYEDIVYHREFT